MPRGDGQVTIAAHQRWPPPGDDAVGGRAPDAKLRFTKNSLHLTTPTVAWRARGIERPFQYRRCPVQVTFRSFLVCASGAVASTGLVSHSLADGRIDEKTLVSAPLGTFNGVQ